MRYSNTEKRVEKKNEAQPSFFNQLRSVWISDKTLFRVFDIASRSIDNSSRNSKEKFSKFHNNRPFSKIPQYSLFVPPKFCINIVSIFSLDLLWSQEKIKAILLQNFGETNKEYYGVFESDLLG